MTNSTPVNPEVQISSAYPKIKEIMDFVVSVILIVILSPLFALISIIIVLTSWHFPIFVQERIGKDGRPFNLYKFRTMKNSSDFQPQRKPGELFKVNMDPRVTRIGKILRRTCLDEMPQLFNVINGDMSIVGPRPHLPIETENLNERGRQRFRVKPGITGPWQVGGRHKLRFDDAISLDIHYANNMSLWRDIKILLKTIPAIIFSEGPW